MAGRSASDVPPQAEEVAAYVATMARELKIMVERHDLSVLAYLLDLVRMEADARAGDQRFAGSDIGDI